MLGTQSPMKIAWSGFPLKNNTSEYIKERNAEINSSLSVRLNFLSMVSIALFPTCEALRSTPRFFSGFWSPLFPFRFRQATKVATLQFVFACQLVAIFSTCSQRTGIADGGEFYIRPLGTAAWLFDKVK